MTASHTITRSAPTLAEAATTGSRRRKPDMAGKALTLRVTLPGTDPEVWRLVQVPAEMTLLELSDSLETAFGWYGDHLHTFHARGVTYWRPPMYDDGDVPFEDDSEYQVGQLLWRCRMKLVWVYDLGDCWHHDIVVEAIDRPDPTVDLPRCVAGGAADPLEDAGGMWGYYETVHALNDKNHPSHSDAVELLGEDFDPARFDGVELVAPRRDLPDTPEGLAAAAAGDDHRLRVAALSHPSCPPAALAAAVEHTYGPPPDVPDGFVASTWTQEAEAALSHPACPVEILARAARADTLPDGRDISWQRRHAAANPSCPPELLIELSADASPVVADAANLSLPRPR